MPLWLSVQQHREGGAPNNQISGSLNIFCGYPTDSWSRQCARASPDAVVECVPTLISACFLLKGKPHNGRCCRMVCPLRNFGPPVVRASPPRSLSVFPLELADLFCVMATTFSCPTPQFCKISPHFRTCSLSLFLRYFHAQILVFLPVCTSRLPSFSDSVPLATVVNSGPFSDHPYY